MGTCNPKSKSTYHLLRGGLRGLRRLRSAVVVGVPSTLGLQAEF